ncbi:hypothetical protein L6164_022504 [Bauhinia variegata]|uniref:Uncharacterized protein n=1 Tax=Bauhinia variegata TaxID=167791 RepID=A0ACB9MFV1_BAUVA|nr:hypothetical protein L6164_022504 [Bauhinia variegata]
MPASELGDENGKKKKLGVIVATTIVATLGMLLLGCYFIHKARRRRRRRRRKMTEEPKSSTGEHVDDLDLPLLDLSIIAMATDNFSMKNKIGEGGFGPVYKGILVNDYKWEEKQRVLSCRPHPYWSCMDVVEGGQGC